MTILSPTSRGVKPNRPKIGPWEHNINTDCSKPDTRPVLCRLRGGSVLGLENRLIELEPIRSIYLINPAQN